MNLKQFDKGDWFLNSAHEHCLYLFKEKKKVYVYNDIHKEIQVLGDNAQCQRAREISPCENPYFVVVIGNDEIRSIRTFNNFANACTCYFEKCNEIDAGSWTFDNETCEMLLAGGKYEANGCSVNMFPNPQI